MKGVTTGLRNKRLISLHLKAGKTAGDHNALNAVLDTTGVYWRHTAGVAYYFQWNPYKRSSHDK